MQKHFTVQNRYDRYAGSTPFILRSRRAMAGVSDAYGNELWGSLLASAMYYLLYRASGR
jgi:hypothetical protein